VLTLHTPDYTDIPAVLLKHLYKLAIQFSGSQGGVAFFLKYSEGEGKLVPEFYGNPTQA
jgi:hypothetical protein